MRKIFTAIMLIAATPALAFEDPVMNDYYDAHDRITQKGDAYYDSAVQNYENNRVKEFELYQYRKEDGQSGYMYMAPVQ